MYFGDISFELKDHNNVHFDRSFRNSRALRAQDLFWSFRFMRHLVPTTDVWGYILHMYACTRSDMILFMSPRVINDPMNNTNFCILVNSDHISFLLFVPVIIINTNITDTSSLNDSTPTNEIQSRSIFNSRERIFYNQLQPFPK